MDDLTALVDNGTTKKCPDCDQIIAIESRYCRNCGSVQNNDEEEILAEQKWINTKQVALFFIFDAVICAIASFIDYFKTVRWSIATDSILAVVAVTFFCDNWSKNKYLLAWRNFSILKLLYYCGIAIVASVIVNFVINWLNLALFSEEFSYYAFYEKYDYAVVLTIFFTAVTPALFEELAYRGFVLEKLLGTVDKKQAIFISAFLFSIMHMSFISLFWLVPFALLLAHVRIKENTLWYGIFMHFSFNFTACMIEIHKYRH